jgi:hypothetical protein
MGARADLARTASSPAAVGDRQILAVQMRRNRMPCKLQNIRSTSRRGSGPRVAGPAVLQLRFGEDERAGGHRNTRYDTIGTLDPSDNRRMGLLTQRYLGSFL